MEEKLEKILVIEDDEDNQAYTARSLVNAGYEVSCASTGNEGLEKFSIERPDLVVLDVLLPDIDGWEVLNKLRAEHHGTKIPIIMLTVKDSERDKLGGYIMGADYYIGKPFIMGLLLQKVAELLKERAKKQ
jgi:DNA-binding response OmpR family regulator